MTILSDRRGFTLIELLVVIAIIGVLSSVVLASLNTARQKGRDARRISDVNQLRLALELYYDANGAYPAALTTAAVVTPGYIASMPTDPSNAAAYAYSPYAPTGATAICSGYHLGASLEVNNTAMGTDADVTTLTISGSETNPYGLVQCTASGATADFHGADGGGACLGTHSGTICYDVRS